MSVGKKEKVFSFAIHFKPGILVQGMKEKRCHKISAAQGASWVPALHGVNHPDNIPPDLAGGLLQFLYTGHNCFYYGSEDKS
ncbi:MAG: hypothetical protein NVSMB63_14520 [Sediminibacterium sp.]